MRDAAKALVTALYLYPHYRVDSRGPRGCILDALAVIAPDVCSRLRDGEDPESVMETLRKEDGCEQEHE